MKIFNMNLGPTAGALLLFAASLPLSTVNAGKTPARSLWYDRPATEWTEALPVGNGRLGAMVFGGAPQERLRLNEESLWAGEPFDVYPDDFAANLRQVYERAHPRAS